MSDDVDTRISLTLNSGIAEVIEEAAEACRGEKIVVGISTPTQAGERVKVANEPFAVPVLGVL